MFSKQCNEDAGTFARISHGDGHVGMGQSIPLGIQSRDGRRTAGALQPRGQQGHQYL
jgi:hypothetical protein